MNRQTKIPLILVFLVVSPVYAGEFKTDQMRYPRVRDAYQQKLDIVKEYFTENDVDYPPDEMLIRIFKMEKGVELWARDDDSDEFKLIKTYKIAYLSGELGPKRRRGDLQVPEGIYHISGFNPASSFHLSVRINYPNKSDRILGYKPDLGGDIFIHGSDVSIGCVPITDECIKELYIILVDVKDSGSYNIPVHIFPFRFEKWETGDNVEPELKIFWDNLESVYQYFKEKHQLPKVNVDPGGHYTIE